MKTSIYMIVMHVPWLFNMHCRPSVKNWNLWYKNSLRRGRIPQACWHYSRLQTLWQRMYQMSTQQLHKEEWLPWTWVSSSWLCMWSVTFQIKSQSFLVWATWVYNCQYTVLRFCLFVFVGVLGLKVYTIITWLYWVFENPYVNHSKRQVVNLKGLECRGLISCKPVRLCYYSSIYFIFS